jgi:hypothetical protein
MAIFRFHLEKLFCEVVIQLCKRALVLRTHHLRVRLGMAYSTGVKSYYHPDACICTCGGLCAVGWCLDNLCGGSFTGSFCYRSQYQCGILSTVMLQGFFLILIIIRIIISLL